MRRRAVASLQGRVDGSVAQREQRASRGGDSGRHRVGPNEGQGSSGSAWSDCPVSSQDADTIHTGTTGEAPGR
jgi:hypothetical protein